MITYSLRSLIIQPTGGHFSGGSESLHRECCQPDNPLLDLSLTHCFWLWEHHSFNMSWPGIFWWNPSISWATSGLHSELVTPRLKSSVYPTKVKLATVVKGDQKVPFSIATTPRCGGGCYSFSWIAPLYPWYVPYIGEC